MTWTRTDTSMRLDGGWRDGVEEGRLTIAREEW